MYVLSILKCKPVVTSARTSLQGERYPKCTISSTNPPSATWQKTTRNSFVLVINSTVTLLYVAYSVQSFSRQRQLRQWKIRACTQGLHFPCFHTHFHYFFWSFTTPMYFYIIYTDDRTIFEFGMFKRQERAHPRPHPHYLLFTDYSAVVLRLFSTEPHTITYIWSVLMETMNSFIEFYW